MATNTAKEVSTKEAAQFGTEYGQAIISSDNLLGVKLREQAAVIEQGQLDAWYVAAKEQLEMAGYKSPASAVSRHKGALLFCIAYRERHGVRTMQADMKSYTVQEMYEAAKQYGITQNNKGAGNRRMSKAEKIHKALKPLVKQYGKAALKAELAKL